jgi:hypothetical protein
MALKAQWHQEKEEGFIGGERRSQRPAKAEFRGSCGISGSPNFKLY